jgi:four helix bundle protein
MSLVLNIYKSTDNFPKTETYGLASQLRRAAVSIPSNIAEGQARLTTAEFK